MGGSVTHVGHSISLPMFTCGCSLPHENGDGEPDNPRDPSMPFIDVSFSAPAVIYEDAYVNAPGDTVAKRSTQVTVSVSVYGGDNGASYHISKENLGSLIPLEGPLDIPASGTLEPYESLDRSFVCEGGVPKCARERR